MSNVVATLDDEAVVVASEVVDVVITCVVEVVSNVVSDCVVVGNVESVASVVRLLLLLITLMLFKVTFF